MKLVFFIKICNKLEDFKMIFKQFYLNKLITCAFKDIETKSV